MNRSSAALRLFGDQLIPSLIFDHFPSQAWTKSYQFTTSSGKTVRRNTGAWILDATPSETGDFDGQIAELLTHIQVGPDIWQSLGQRFEIDIDCGCFMGELYGGVAMSPQSLLKLGERNIALSIEIYAPSGDACP